MGRWRLQKIPRLRKLRRAARQPYVIKSTPIAVASVRGWVIVVGSSWQEDALCAPLWGQLHRGGSPPSTRNLFLHCDEPRGRSRLCTKRAQSRQRSSISQQSAHAEPAFHSVLRRPMSEADAEKGETRCMCVCRRSWVRLVSHAPAPAVLLSAQ